MSREFQQKVHQEMDRTGLNEVTAAKIVSGRMAAPPDPEIAHIGEIAPRMVLYAPPTANEPDAIPLLQDCPDCGGVGFVLEKVPFGHPNFGKLLPCGCKLAGRTARQQEQQIAVLSRLDTELGALAHCRIDSFDLARASDAASRATLALALAAARECATDFRAWLYLWGPCGVGKSHLAAALAHEAVRRNLRARYASVPALLRFVKAGFRDDSSDERITALQVVELLVLDDIGAEYHPRPGDYGDTVLWEIINQRYLYSRMTVITSNLSLDELEPRIASRIRGRARIVHLDNDDQRGKTGARL